jgi:hypothetical protein
MPHINRKFSRPFYLANVASIYLTTLPANWLLTKLGFGPVILGLTTKIAEGPQGRDKHIQPNGVRPHLIY